MKHLIPFCFMLLLSISLNAQINPTTRLLPADTADVMLLTKLSADGKYRYYPTPINDISGMDNQQLQAPVVSGDSITLILEDGGSSKFSVADQDNDAANELDNITTSPSPPSFPKGGDVWINDSNGEVSQFDPISANWVLFPNSAGGDGDSNPSNEGMLSVLPGTSGNSIISSNTIGSTDVTIAAGANIAIAESGNTITITSTGGITNVSDTDDMDLTLSSGTVSATTKLNPSTNNLIAKGVSGLMVDRTGNWTGTFASQNSAYYLNATNHTNKDWTTISGNLYRNSKIHVGGTSNPVYALQVTTPNNNAVLVKNPDPAGAMVLNYWNDMDVGPIFLAYGSGNSAGGGRFQVGPNGSAIHTFGEFAIGTSNANDFKIHSNNALRMIFKATGNIGIGTSTPTEKLEVSGIAKATDLIATSLSSAAPVWSDANGKLVPGTPGVIGSGLTTDYLTKWNGTNIINSKLRESGSVLYVESTDMVFTSGKKLQFYDPVSVANYDAVTFTSNDPIISVGDLDADLKIQGDGIFLTDNTGLSSAQLLKTNVAGKIQKGTFPTVTESIQIKNPTGSEDITVFRATKNITIVSCHSILVGGSTPQVSWQLKHASNLSGTLTNTYSSNQSTTSISTGTEHNSGFNDNTIADGEWVKVTTSLVNGTVTDWTLVIEYTID